MAILRQLISLVLISSIMTTHVCQAVTPTASPRGDDLKEDVGGTSARSSPRPAPQGSGSDSDVTARTPTSSSPTSTSSTPDTGGTAEEQDEERDESLLAVGVDPLRTFLSINGGESALPLVDFVGCGTRRPSDASAESEVTEKTPSQLLAAAAVNDEEAINDLLAVFAPAFHAFQGLEHRMEEWAIRLAAAVLSNELSEQNGGDLETGTRSMRDIFRQAARGRNDYWQWVLAFAR